MYLDKTQYETNFDLGLYIEGLLNPDEAEVEKENTVATKKLNDVVSKFDVSAVKTEAKIDEQSQIPLWGQKPFECLLVKSAGMNLIVPAMSVSYIERINKNIIRLPLDAEAFRGVVTLRERSVAIIDLFSLVSENTSVNNQQAMQVDSHQIEYVMVMDNGNYALACDDVGEMKVLNTENVRWNKASFNNPIFAGIVSEYLCPIVNIDNVQQQVAAMPFVQSLNNNH
jgi:purine-binding chemotaxis protein CheW